MTEQIYINGVRMDTTPGKGASLIFQSPYFTDLDNVVSNRTTSVELPATPNNLQAIDRADLVSGTSKFGARRHRVDYYLDGILIFTGAALLLSLTPTGLKFSFVWGNIEAFQQLMDVNLQDLQRDGHLLDASSDYVDYSRTAVDTSPYYLTNWKSPANWGGELVHSVQPMMPVKELLGRITEHCGVKFQFSAGNSFDDYYIPLLTRKYDDYSRVMQGVVLNCCDEAKQTVRLGGDNVPYPIYTDIKITGGVKHNGNGLFDARLRIMDVDGIETLAVKVLAGFKFVSKKANDFLNVGAASHDGTFWYRNLARLSDDSVTHEAISGGFYLHTYTEEVQVRIDIVGANASGIIVYYNSTDAAFVSEGHEGFGPSMSEIPRIELYDAGLEELEFAEGTLFPLYRNLPDWTVSQLLKNLMKLEGLFAYASDAKTLRFVSIGQLYDRRREAIDWTDRLILTAGAPSERSSSFGNFARRNWCRYTEDDTVPENFDAAFDIDDTTLDAETDILTCDFAPTQGHVIPLWQRDDDGEWSFEEVEPRILKSSGTEGLVSFFDLSWSKILTTKYASYRNIVGNIHLVKVSVRLSASELHDLDLTRPVYARQWGHYYVINKLTTKSDGTADVELLRLGAAETYSAVALPGHEGFEEVEGADEKYRIQLANNDGSYYIKVSEVTKEREQALVDDPDYHLCLVRYGYTRRGENKLRWDRNQKRMTGTHTDRKKFRDYRGKQTWRIMGHEILQRGSLSPHSQLALSPLYKDATLVFELGQPISLPHVEAGVRTRSGRIANRSRNGTMELYVGLYQRMTQKSVENAAAYERWGWQLVSNLVQVRGRNVTNTRYWDFDPSKVLG